MDETTPDAPTFSRSRRWGRGVTSVLGVAGLLAIVVMVNYLAAGWYQRWEWARDGRFDLSPRTERLLRSITNDVEVILCFDVKGQEELHGWSVSLLRQFEHINPRIRVQTIDYTRAAGTAARMMATNQFATLRDIQSTDFILFNSGGRRRVVFANELSDYDSGNMVGDQVEFRRVGFKGELLFSSALFAVTSARQPKAYFVQGHGEHDPENISGDLGYGKFAAMLREEYNVDWATVSLRGTNDLSDADLLIIAGAGRAPFEASELAKLDGFLRQGGRALILMSHALRPNAPTGLETYLTNWNVGVSFGVVSDKENSLSSANDILAFPERDHPITRPLAADTVLLPIRLMMPRMVGPMRDTTVGGLKVQPLAKTGDNGIEEYAAIENGQVVAKARQGSLPLIVAMEQGGIAGVSAGPGTTRLVVVGDSMCFDNQMLESATANRYFAGFAVNWLLDRPQAMLEIPSKRVSHYHLLLSARQQRTLNWILLGAMPGGALLLGGLVWLKRRR